MISIPNKSKVHIVGIGGIGMSAIAEILLNLGCSVSGSDQMKSANTEKLQQLGVKIYIGHNEENINDANIVVYSTAIPLSNLEVKSAIEKSVPVLKRSEILADIMRLKNGIAVAGTHGKTTTTSLVSTILYECGVDPTYLIGGIVSNLKGHARVGSGKWFVAEADESDGTFLELNPIISTITNIDMDHLDFYKSEEALVNAFEKFGSLIPFYGKLTLNASDELLRKISKKIRKPFCWYGVGDSDLELDYMAKNLNTVSDKTTFDFYYQGELVSQFSVSLVGKHNIENALAAISVCHSAGLSFLEIKKGLSKFEGVGRRMQVLCNTPNLKIVDDYGHHPTEVSSTLQALSETKGDKKLIAIFEPHRFSRTKNCWENFLHSFNLADKLYLLPIYSAGESEIDGITSQRLSDDINNLHPGFSSAVSSLEEIEDFSSSENNLILTLGAGSIGKKVRSFLKKINYVD
mgnify:CR=1 FL=1